FLPSKKWFNFVPSSILVGGQRSDLLIVYKFSKDLNTRRWFFILVPSLCFTKRSYWKLDDRRREIWSP
ncbi:unnamed protein product, partial [Amoebophrya sp. A25]